MGSGNGARILLKTLTDNNLLDGDSGDYTLIADGGISISSGTGSLFAILDMQGYGDAATQFRFDTSGYPEGGGMNMAMWNAAGEQIFAAGHEVVGGTYDGIVTEWLLLIPPGGSGNAVNEISNDAALADSSEDAIVTEAAIKAYVDAQVVGGGGATTLDGLTDVDTAGVANGQVLRYTTSGNQWIPATLSYAAASGYTINRVLTSNGSGQIAVSTVTTTSLGYLDATSSIQTQLNGKAATTHNHTGTYAPAAEGVTNGNSHDHNGGDGGTIAFSSIGSQPTTLSGYGITDAASDTELSTHASSTGNGAHVPSVGSSGQYLNNYGAFTTISWSQISKGTVFSGTRTWVDPNTADVHTVTVSNGLITSWTAE
jgi:hypothetical protein